MRTDSTHLLGVVRRLSQLELVTESMRVVLGAITAVAPEWVSQALPAVFVERYERRQSEYGLSADEVRQALLQVGSDGHWFVAQIDQAASVVLRQLPEVEVLRTVLRQQFPPGGGGGPAAKRPTGRSVIESPHEPEARYATKRGQNWVGYKVQGTETCDEDYPHLITDLEVTGALDNDSPELPKIQARLDKQRTMPGEQQVDQGYMSGQNLVDSAARGINLMGVPLADTQGPPGFRQADFQVDEEARKATCPAGQSSVVWSECQRSGYSAPSVLIRFEAQTCQCCPYFGRCTTSLHGRSLTLHPHRAALSARRAEAQTEAFRQRLHLRAGSEATISELVRGHRLRWARYRRQAKVRLQAYFTAVAVNLKRLVRWWVQARLQEVTRAVS